jgi:hypothetical protein
MIFYLDNLAFFKLVLRCGIGIPLPVPGVFISCEHRDRHWAGNLLIARLEFGHILVYTKYFALIPSYFPKLF